jgi:hypothetical protein
VTARVTACPHRAGTSAVPRQGEAVERSRNESLVVRQHSWQKGEAHARAVTARPLACSQLYWLALLAWAA